MWAAGGSPSSGPASFLSWRSFWSNSRRFVLRMQRWQLAMGSPSNSGREGEGRVRGSRRAGLEGAALLVSLLGDVEEAVVLAQLTRVFVFRHPRLSPTQPGQG